MRRPPTLRALQVRLRADQTCRMRLAATLENARNQANADVPDAERALRH